MVKYVPMIDDINPLAALNLYFPGTFDMWAILGANSRQTKLPGCGCYQRAPTWHGIRDVFPGPESATTPYRERSGPRKDHSQWQGHTGSPADAQGVSEPKSLWLDETRSTSEFHPKTTTVHQKNQLSIQKPHPSIQKPQQSIGIQKPPQMKVCSFNTCSLRKHMEDIRSDPVLLQSDILFVLETWLEKCEEEQEQYQLEGYRAHFASQGRGKGLAAYIKAGIRSIITIFGQPNFQIVKFDMANIDVIGIYRSRTEPLSQLTQHLRQFINPEKDTLIVGDVNVCATKNNELGNFLQKERFCQLVSLPTHICGGIHLKHNLIKHVFSNSCTWHNIALFRNMYNENIYNRFTC